MTTRVYVVYVLDKHIHAFKLLISSVYKRVFGGRVYVWRLILKKKSTIRQKSTYLQGLNGRHIIG